MITPSVFTALLAVVPSVLAQGIPDIPDVTSSFTRCTTRFGYQPLPTGSAGPPTWFEYTTTTNTFSLTYTTRDTITETPSATTFTDVATSTEIVTTITTSVPPATTIAAQSGFLPLILAAVPEPTAISRVKRLQDLEVKRQTADGNTGGFIVNPDGSTSSLNRIYPHRVLCQVRVTVNTTDITVETAAPTTVVLPVSTATIQSTSTVTSTTTITEVRPTPSVYAACAANNVVNHITDRDGNTMNFDRLVWHSQAGLPIANELVTNTSTPTNCCIACQTSPNCAGSFYVPSRSECHLRFTVPQNLSVSGLVPANGTANGTITAFGPTATGVAPISTAAPSSCARGSDTLYLGTVRGRRASEFPSEFALYVSNGNCGRFSVSPIRIPSNPAPAAK